MKKILLSFLLLTGLALPQVSLDSAAAKYTNADVLELWGRATFVETPSAGQYDIGFIMGNGRENLSFAPMGSYTWNNSLKQLTWVTELANVRLGSKLYFAPQIIPKNVKSKVVITGEVGWLDDIYQEPYIEWNLPRQLIGEIDSTVTFEWNVSGNTITYEWFRRTVNVDSTVGYLYDSLGVVIDSFYTYDYSWNDPVKINGQTQASFVSPPLQWGWDGMKVFSIATGSIGDPITSRQCLLRIIGGKFNYLRPVGD